MAAVYLDLIAQRYGCLPSAVFEHGNSIDFWVMKQSQAYYQAQESQQSGKKKADMPDVNTMQQMIRRLRDVSDQA
jgi:hypothetical protein